MNIVIVGNPNSAHVRRYVTDLSTMGHEIHLIGEHRLNQTIPDKCSYYDLTLSGNIRKLRYLLWSTKIYQLTKQIQPDIVHAIGVASAGWLAASSNFHPFVVTATGSDLMLLEQRGFLHQFLSQMTIRKAERVICVSKPLYERALKLGADNEKTSLIYIGVDTNTFHPRDQKVARRRLGLSKGNLVISIRAMSSIYRPLDLANAIPLVLASLPETQFAIFTYNHEPETLVAFQKIIKHNRADYAVSYIEAIPDDHTIALYYQAADLAVSIPESDGTPSSVLEAMSCGLPVVATDIPSLRDWIIPGQSGIFVPVGDVQAIANAIMETLQNQEERLEMRNRAIRLVDERANRSKCLDALQGVYRELIKYKGSSFES